MSDLITRSQRGLEALTDSSLSTAQQIEKAASCLDGLMLSDLEDHIKHQLTSTLARYGAVTQPYDLSPDDSLERLSPEDQESCWQIFDTALRDAMAAEVERLIAELEQADDVLPKGTILEIRQHRQLMIPRLIQCLIESARQALQDPDAKVSNAAIFALFLLSEFNARSALPTILQVIALPNDTSSSLFGDVVTDLLPGILAQLAYPNLEQLIPLIENREADELVRSAAVDAYGQCYLAGMITREQALDKIKQFFQWAVRHDDFELATWIVICLCSLGAHELAEEVKAAFEDQLIDESIIDLEGALEQLNADPQVLERRKQLALPLGVPDCIAEMSQWEMFKPKRPATQSPIPRAVSPSSSHSIAASPSLSHRLSDKVTRTDRPGRNDPCPCGSNKKFKKCCGR